MIIVLLVILEILVATLIFCYMMLDKNNNTYAMHEKILNAILEYRLQCIDQGESFKVEFDDMEPYERTLFRLWDWSYTNILPKEKFEIIKPYIKEEQK